MYYDTYICVVAVVGNKHKWVPLMIEVKSEGPRERSASRNNTRQFDAHRVPPNGRNDLRGAHTSKHASYTRHISPDTPHEHTSARSHQGR